MVKRLVVALSRQKPGVAQPSGEAANATSVSEYSPWWGSEISNK